jgi:hypothetical protein
MTIEKIRSFRNAQPFKPFDILTKDGGKVHVALPERIALAPDGEMLGVHERSVPHFLEVAAITKLRTTRKRKHHSG